MFSLKGCIGFRWSAVKCPSQARIDGKTVVITGGNTGIGKETAIELAKRGGRILICCRDAEKAETAVSEIKTSSDSDNVASYSMDLLSLESVRECVDELLRKEAQIDILINNAGIMLAPFSKSVDGIESHMATNHFGHFLLTHLLLPTLKKSTDPRIINVTSIKYQEGRIRFDDMNEENGYKAGQAYADSKLANVLFTRQLAKFLKNTNIHVYCVHPGLVNSELFRHAQSNSCFYYLVSIVMKVIAKSSEQGAQTSIYCAVSEEAANESGLYYAECKVEPYVDVALDDDDAQMLWDLSISVVGLDKKLESLDH